METGQKFASCSCDYGCPCEFNAPPTNDICEGPEEPRIDEGWSRDVRLGGLIIAARYRWTGLLHEGGGIVQGIISEQATDAHRDAHFQILEGKRAGTDHHL